MPPPPGVVATRRTALAGALGGALALTGCDAEPPVAEPSPTSSPTATPTPDDPDQALVDQVVAELEELISVVSSATLTWPGLGSSLKPFAKLHEAHRRVLSDSGSDVFATTRSGTRAEVARAVRRREERAQRQLAEWAIAAESGALARLLASMSAAIAQQLAAPAKGTP